MQWRSQDTEVARAQRLHAAEGSVQRRVYCRAFRAKRRKKKKFSPSFFTYQDGLLWHFCASHCKQS